MCVCRVTLIIRVERTACPRPRPLTQNFVLLHVFYPEHLGVLMGGKHNACSSECMYCCINLRVYEIIQQCVYLYFYLLFFIRLFVFRVLVCFVFFSFVFSLIGIVHLCRRTPHLKTVALQER